MLILSFFYTFILFVLLTPSILFKLPKTGNKWVVACVHGLLFTIIIYFTHTFFWDLNTKEQFKLYSDKNCKKILASPSKQIPNRTVYGVYFNDIDINKCIGPYSMGDPIFNDPSFNDPSYSDTSFNDPSFSIYRSS
jgi:hypothetical protein